MKSFAYELMKLTVIITFHQAPADHEPRCMLLCIPAVNALLKRAI